jgi:hypothetical protein
MEILQKRPLLGNDKYQSLTALYTHTTAKELLGAVFSHWSTKKRYTESLQASSQSGSCVARNQVRLCWQMPEAIYPEKKSVSKSWVPRGLKPKMTVLARASSNLPDSNNLPN